MKIEFPGPSSPEAKQPPKKSAWDRLTESPMARALALAGILHAGAPKAAKGVELVKNAAAEIIKSAWNMEHMVVDYQTPEQMKEWTARKQQREARIDHAALDSYKEQVAKDIEQGKDVSFKRTHFDLERLNGVSEDEVKRAEQGADAKVDTYVNAAGDKLEPTLISRIVNEMYGPKEAYDSGQASAARYFNTGERNCVAIADAEQIVFEGILLHLSATERAQWRQSVHFEKQHRIAALEHVGPDGKRDTLYLLEPGREPQVGAEDEPGTANVSAETIKKAMVGKGHMVVSAASKEGVKVQTGPELRAVTDQPVELGIQFEGEFKGSDFNREQATWMNIKPRHMSEAEIAEQEARIKPQTIETDLEIVQEIDFAGKQDVKGNKAEGLPKVKERGPEQATKLLEGAFGLGNDTYFYSPVDGLGIRGVVKAQELVNPSRETIAALGQEVRDEKGTELAGYKVENRASLIEYGDMSNWSTVAIDQALKNKVDAISIMTNRSGDVSGHVLNEYAGIGLAEKQGFSTIKLDHRYDSKADPQIFPGSRQLEVLFAPKQTKVVDISAMSKEIYPLAIGHILGSVGKDQTLVINGSEMADKDLEELGKARGTIRISMPRYLKLLHEHPAMLKNDHLAPDLASWDDIDGLAALQTEVRRIQPGHPLIQQLKQVADTLPGMGQVPYDRSAERAAAQAPGPLDKPMDKPSK